jgi:trimeric autotransporter adhesin
MKIIITFLLFFMLTSVIYAQNNITNTLGTGGLFIIKDSSNGFLTVDQSTGQINIDRTLRLENTFSPSLGVIFKGANRFLHDYKSSGTVGGNTFLGINAGNFTMSGTTYQASYNTGIGYSVLSNISTGSDNTAMGYYSLYFNTDGYQNTALGNNTLYVNSSGYQNTALGYQSLLANSIGHQNTAIGVQSLYSNDGGNYNTAIGFQSLYSNIGGFKNTALGLGSLQYNTSGSNNTASGFNSLFSNTTGGDNTATGYLSLANNTTGTSNTASGFYSLYSNTTGSSNTASGNYTLQSNTIGHDNTAFGYYSGHDITSGSNLTCLGSNAQPTSATATNQITLGNNVVGSLRCNVTTITSLSDARDKKNITDLNLGIDFLMKIKPRQFNWDKREWYENNKSDGSKMKEEPTAGFIAQELAETQTTEKAEWLNLVLKDNPEKWEATPGNLLPIMVKAIQDLKAENEQLRIQLADVGEIKEQIAEVKTLKAELKEQIKILRASNDSEKVRFSSIINESIDK